MTNSIAKFAVVSTKEMVSKSGVAVQFPAQLRLQIVNGDKTQVVSFGYSRLGGRTTYLSVQGKAPVAMKRNEFIKLLTAKNIAGASTVIARLNKMSAVYGGDVIVAKCKVCSTGRVTAANMDFIQRNNASLSERLGKEITPFTPVCFSCQGKKNSKAPSVTSEAPAIKVAPAKAAPVATCESCDKAIHSKKVVTVSRKKYGKVLCYPTCQSQATPVAKAEKKAAAPAVKISHAAASELVAVQEARTAYQPLSLESTVDGLSPAAAAELEAAMRFLDGEEEGDALPESILKATEELHPVAEGDIEPDEEAFHAHVAEQEAREAAMLEEAYQEDAARGAATSSPQQPMDDTDRDAARMTAAMEAIDTGSETTETTVTAEEEAALAAYEEHQSALVAEELSGYDADQESERRLDEAMASFDRIEQKLLADKDAKRSARKTPAPATDEAIAALLADDLKL